ncbi:MAG: hypothetical protein IME99_06100 [Proteobacteria bacterium]|nr:hypothetical protein [Pseudomonadota bacterium]
MSLKAVEEKVMEYIRANPTVELDADKISEWWHGLQALDGSIDNVTTAIETLVEDEKIAQNVLDDDIFIYKLV